MSVLTFHNDQAEKARLIARLDEHARLDSFVQGGFWGAIRNGTWLRFTGSMSAPMEEMKGCAIGCSLVDPGTRLTQEMDAGLYMWHAKMEEVWGIALWVAMLEDFIFENMSVEDCKGWPLRFAHAVPVGVQLGQEFADVLSLGRLREMLTIVPESSSSIRELVQGGIDCLMNGVGSSEVVIRAEVLRDDDDEIGTQYYAAAAVRETFRILENHVESLQLYAQFVREVEKGPYGEIDARIAKSEADRVIAALGALA